MGMLMRRGIGGDEEEDDDYRARVKGDRVPVQCQPFTRNAIPSNPSCALILTLLLGNHALVSGNDTRIWREVSITSLNE